jgi:predicted short-subunit dehydrogenase-like oxidoreductase (DUF2520 family)
VAEPEPSPEPVRRAALIGPGRAGVAVAGALATAGWRIVGVAGRDPDAPGVQDTAARFGAVVGTPAEVAARVDLVVIATPDRVVGSVAAVIADVVAPDALVVHLAGALGLDVLAPVRARTATLHPLQSLPGAPLGQARLAGAYAAVSGDDAVADLARAIGMIPFRLADFDRVRYHAAACIASNHLVALLAQVEACTDVPLEAFLPLVRATVDNVAALGTGAALTGPVARGDVATIRAHREAIPASELDAYLALARRAAVLAGREEELAGVLA